MTLERVRADLQWLRGEDGVASAARAEEVLARVLSPLFASEGLVVSQPTERTAPQFDLVANDATRQSAHPANGTSRFAKPGWSRVAPVPRA